MKRRGLCAPWTSSCLPLATNPDPYFPRIVMGCEAKNICFGGVPSAAQQPGGLALHGGATGDKPHAGISW